MKQRYIEITRQIKELETQRKELLEQLLPLYGNGEAVSERIGNYTLTYKKGYERSVVVRDYEKYCLAENINLPEQYITTKNETRKPTLAVVADKGIIE